MLVVPQPHDEAMERIMTVLRENCTEDQGVIMSTLVKLSGVSRDRLSVLLSELWTQGKVLRLATMSPHTKAIGKHTKMLYMYVPNEGHWMERVKDDIPMTTLPKAYSIGNGISPYERMLAKARCKIGEKITVLKWSWSEDEKCFSGKAVVRVVAKSKHLIVCDDGSTYSYAALALHYRNRSTPCGYWMK